MVATGLARLRLAATVALGAPISSRSLETIAAGARATFREYGTVGGGQADVAGSAALDPSTRRELAEQGLRKQAVRAGRETPYYSQLFERLGYDPTAATLAEIEQLPVTGKEALREQPDGFVRRGARPYLCALTTGTTGRPASVSYSRCELDAYAAMSTVHGLVSRQITPDDVVQVSISLRAALATTIALGTCARVGAAAYLAGQLDPATTLQLLSERRTLPGKRARVSILLAYASYLGELVEAARALGHRPGDFGLRSVRVGGEVVTPGLLERARQVFGPVEFVQGYASTELDPINGSECSEGHLHFQPSSGLVEVRSLDGPRPALPGEPGTIVATPFGPFRETTLLLRYDTQDVARALPGDPTCTLRGLPGISKPLGRRPLSVEHDSGWTFQRPVIEALESLDIVTLPARYGFWRVPGGVAVEVRTRSLGSSERGAVAAALEQRGVPVRELHLTDDPRHLRNPLPVRADLRDASFERVAA